MWYLGLPSAYMPLHYSNTNHPCQRPENQQNQSPIGLDWFEYYNVIDRFYMDYVRIPETELQMFSVWDIDREFSDRFVRAEKIADLLLSSEQKIIIPNKDTAEKNFGEELCLTKSN